MTWFSREAVGLLVLFVSQVVAEFYVIQTYTEPAVTSISIQIWYAYTAVYAVLGIALFVKRRESVRELIERTALNTRSAIGGSSGHPKQAD